MSKLLRDLLNRQDESVTLEFKREIRLISDPDKNEFAKDISAFANTKGGHILYGKEDKKEGGRIVGIKPETFDEDQMQQIVYGRCEPSVEFNAKLVQDNTLFFALLTIRESISKPHHIIQSKDVWMRRNAITVKATPRESMEMKREAERKRRTLAGKKKPINETSLASFRERAQNVTLACLLILIYIPFRLGDFWIFGQGSDLINWFRLEVLLGPFLTMGVAVFIAYLLGIDLIKKTVGFLRRILVTYLFSLAVFNLVVLILNLMMLIYPTSVSTYFQNIWLNFLIVSLELLGIALIAITLSYFPTTQFILKQENSKYTPKPVDEAKKFLQELKSMTRVLSRRFPITILAISLAIAVLIIPADITWGLFTPAYRQGNEIATPSIDSMYLFIYSERVSPGTVQSQYKFYRLFETAYFITPPKLPLLNRIRIPNPSSAIHGSKNKPQITPQDNWNYTSVSTPQGVNYTFNPLEYNFTSIDLNFQTISHAFIANVSYWKLLQDVNVSITTVTPHYTYLGNNTWIEIYTFIIANNEKMPLTIEAFDFDRFMYTVVNATTVKVYSQGGEWFTWWVYQNRRLEIGSIIYPKVSLNLTITFLSYDIS